MQVLAPPDTERILNLPHGHIFHGELSLDQLFFQRPAPGYADCRTPIKGLHQCGSSTRPGGGVSGIPGHNLAREMLRGLSGAGLNRPARPQEPPYSPSAAPSLVPAAGRCPCGLTPTTG